MARFTVRAALIGVGLTLAAAAPSARRPLFEPRVEILAVPLAEPRLGLTYAQSDMGPPTDWAPRPVLYHPAHGLYLVNPGPAAAPDPSLQRFGVDGKRIYRTPLAPALAGAEPAALVAHQLYLGAGGECFLLYSTGYDAAAGLETDFAIAAFDAAGKRTANVKLVGFEWSDRVFRGSDGTVWAYRVTKEKKAHEWSVHDARGAPRFRFQEDGRAELLPDARLLLLPEGRGPYALDASEVRSPVEIQEKGAELKGAEPVAGWGAFFGNCFQAERPGRSGHPELTLVVQLLHVRRAPGGEHLEVVGEAPMIERWSDVDPEDPRHFTIILPQWTHLDENGDLYLVARRGPKNPALVVYRMALRKDVRDRFLPAASAAQ